MDGIRGFRRRAGLEESVASHPARPCPPPVARAVRADAREHPLPHPAFRTMDRPGGAARPREPGSSAFSTAGSRRLRGGGAGRSRGLYYLERLAVLPGPAGAAPRPRRWCVFAFDHVSAFGGSAVAVAVIDAGRGLREGDVEGSAALEEELEGYAPLSLGALHGDGN